MLENLMKSFIDKEKIANNVVENIQDILSDLSEELNCNFTDLFIMIKPINEEFLPKCYVYQFIDGKPKYIREITLQEIVDYF